MFCHRYPSWKHRPLQRARLAVFGHRHFPSMSRPLGEAIDVICLSAALNRNFTKRLADGKGRQADEPRVLHRRLTVLDGFAVNGIADHLDEGPDARIFGDEAVIPALV